MVSVRVDPATGLLPPPTPIPGAAAPVEEFFLEGTEPHETAPVDAGVTEVITGPVAVDAGPAPEAPTPVENPTAPAPTDTDDAGPDDDAPPGLVLPVQ